MATVTIPARTQVTDDFTGKTVSTEDAPVKVKITVNGKAHELDAAKAMAEAFARFIAEPTEENRKSFITVMTGRSISPRTGSASKDTDKAGLTKRAWLRANGNPDVGERGKFTAEQDDAWHKHITDEAKAA